MGAKKKKRSFMRIHCSVEIDLLLREALNSGEDPVLDNAKTGLPLTNEQAIVALCKYRAKGMKYLPSGGCNNYDKLGRCQGHTIKE